MKNRKKDNGILQYEAICQYLGLAIDTPKSIEIYGEKIAIEELPKFKDMKLSTLNYYKDKK
jgi:hypothetical protein